MPGEQVNARPGGVRGARPAVPGKSTIPAPTLATFMVLKGSS